MAPLPRPAVAAALLAAAAAAAALAAAPASGSPTAAAAVRQGVDESFLISNWTLSQSYSLDELLSGEITPESGAPDPADVDDDYCPAALTIASADGPTSGVWVVPNTAVTQDGARCDGPGEFLLVTPAVLEDLAAVPGTVGAQVRELLGAGSGLPAAVTRAVRDAVGTVDGAPVLLGASTGDARVCGDREMDGTTVVMGLEASQTLAIGGGITLPPGRHLITLTAEGDTTDMADNPLCVYTGAAAKPGGAANGSEAAGAACFPAAATAELPTGATVAMADLAVGDRVRVAAGPDAAAFSPVYTFTHRTAGGSHRVVTATTRSGHALTATPGHLVYINGRRAPLGSVAVGDALDVAADAASSVVTSVSIGTAAGLYNPQTLQGDIVVGGVRASTYTTAVKPAVAGALLAPLRALFHLGVTGSWLEAGGDGRLAGALLRALPLRRASA